MSSLKTALLAMLAITMATAAPKNQQARNPGVVQDVPLDEILARVGNIKHGRANPTGRNPTSLRSDNGKAQLREYDILVPTLEPTIHDGASSPPVSTPVNHHKEIRSKKHSSRWRQQSPIGDRSHRTKRHAVSDPFLYWPNGEVVYDYGRNISQITKNLFDDAIAEISLYTCITWKLRSNERDYVLVKDGGMGSGCSSYVGRRGGAQTMNLQQPGCISLSIIVHEMLHALGVYHQHTRSDRDTMVRINWNNVRSGTESNFNKKIGTNMYSTSYDYRSVMHYSRYAFTANGSPTVDPLDQRYNDIIGNAPTIGYRDIMVITRMYECTGPSHSNCPAKSCPREGFLGHDCKCKCETDNGDYSIPAKNCDEGCVDIDSPCHCTSESCDSLPNTTCNNHSKACECDAGYVKHNQVCTLIESIECTELNVDCKCGMKPESCRNFTAICDSTTNMCVCTGQQVEQTGQCIDIQSVSCDAAGKQCGCSAKGPLACSGIANSSCNSETGSCTCSINHHNDGGVCIQASSCTTANLPCHCDIKGSDACTALVNTFCSADTGACECPISTLYQVDNGQCQLTYVSDGSTLAPYVLSSNTTLYDISWVPVSGPDNPNSDYYNVPSNNYYLLADGDTGNIASMETGLIDVATGVNICMKGGVLLYKSRLTVLLIYAYGGVYWGEVQQPESPYSYYLVRFPFPGPTENTFAKIFIEAEYDGNSPGESWHAKLDPIIVELC